MTKWRINKISIENFKFFHRPFELKLDGKNLLLYGENGSGKSSIYWSFYTHFQSCYKQPSIDDAQKYFDSNSTENLRNKFLEDDKRSGIIIEFKATDPKDSRVKTYEDSSERCNTSVTGDTFMQITAGSSSFMNYKFLSSIFDFKNSKQPEIFSIFEADIFPALVLQPAVDLVRLDGSSTSSMTADYWWKYLNNQLSHLPRGTNPNYVKKTSSEYIKYAALLKEFNRQIKNNVTLIETKANQMVSRSFRLEARIQLNYKDAKIEDVPMKYVEDHNKRLVPPRIVVKAEFNHAHAIGRHDVLHPRSFFNEAKLTCMAIAIRFAVVDIMHRADEDGVSALFLDDLLISLDMSTRLDVIDIILGYESNYQILLFTHDYTFYDIIKSKIRQSRQQREWLFKELYSLDDDANAIPDYLLIEDKNATEKAKAFFEQRDYASSANALRRECEEQLKRLLPFNDTIEFTKDPYPKTTFRQLTNMMDALNNFYSNTGISNLTPNIQIYRERLLNPLSHNDVRTPIFKSELLKALNEIPKLRGIEKMPIVSYSLCDEKKEFCIHLKDGGNDGEVHFYFCAEWNKYVWEKNNYYSNPQVHVISSNVGMHKSGEEKTLNSIYTSLKGFVYRADSSRCPSIEDSVQEIR